MKMKNRRRIIQTVACGVLLAMLSGCGQDGRVHMSSRYKEAAESRPDTDWTVAEGDEVILENSRIIFCMDPVTTHFTVTDKSTGAEYQSAVTEELEGVSTARNEQSASELIAGYCDADNQWQELNSSQHSVAYGNYRVLTDQEAVRVYYTLQLLATPPFAPEVLTEEMYQAISEKLGATDMFKVKLMYKYYPVESVTTEAKEIQAKYPYAKEHAIYVLGNSLSETDRAALNRYIEVAGYTAEQYNADLDKLGIKLDEADVPMQFTVPVEYRLTEEGFTASVLTDLITSVNSEYKLHSVALLPYFNCGVVTEEEAFFLLPDGSGSVMRLDTADNAGYTQRIYGRDPACSNQLSAVITKNAVMPLWGYSSSKGSYLALIEGSAAMATVNAYRAGNTEYLSHAYTEFELQGTDSYKMRKSTIELAIFAGENCAEQPLMEYVLLDQQAGLMDMADTYRSRLTEAGTLSAEDQREDMNLYLEFTGYITEPASFLGISYDKKIVLSTLKDITEAVKQLHDDGIDHIYVRLTGYTKDGGLYHGMVNGFSLEPAVGTMEELTTLAELLYENGGGLYLEDDVQVVYRDKKFDGFSSTSDAVRRLDKTLADVSDFNLVTEKDTDGQNIRYLVSPKLYEGLAERFKKELWTKDGTEHIRVSMAAAGEQLVSDFSEADEFDRNETIGAITSSLKLFEEHGAVMTDVGNAYVLGSVGHILNIPLSDSAFPSESFHVPFYQLVLHGSVNYAGEAINMARNQEKARFDSLLAGADPYYSCVTDKEALEELGQYQRRYPVSFEVIYEDILEFWKENRELYALRAGKQVTDYKILADGLYLLEYGETSVVFNETETEAEWNGQTICARDYVIVRE